MDNSRLEKLAAGGINTDDALSRFMGNAALLERFLGKFVSDKNYGMLKEAIDKDDEEGMLNAAHTLKGICGNLSMTKLYDLFDRQVKALREQNKEGALALVDEIDAEYNKIISVING